jgi:hypothetical protein
MIFRNPPAPDQSKTIFFHYNHPFFSFGKFKALYSK